MKRVSQHAKHAHSLNVNFPLVAYAGKTQDMFSGFSFVMQVNIDEPFTPNAVDEYSVDQLIAIVRTPSTATCCVISQITFVSS